MIGCKTHGRDPILITDGMRLYAEFQNTALYRIGSVLYNDMDDIEMIAFHHNSRIWWRL